MSAENNPDSGSEAVLEQARRVIGIERDALSGLINRIDSSFAAAVERILVCTGRVIVSGVGKSGIVGRKIAATLTSTGTPAIFVHPVDFMHGDMGLVSREDVFLAVSKSGETSELEGMLHYCKRLGIKVIAITGRRGSMLCSLSDISLDAGVVQEACPHDLAPTASSTAAMALGDALAVSLLVRRDFRAEDFARLHPAGALGRRLLLRVSEVMVSGADIGTVGPDARMKEVLLELVAKRGICAVADPDGKLAGVVTDGDFKRLIGRCTNFIEIPVAEVMNPRARTVGPDDLCAEAAGKMESHAIISMPVVDDGGRVVGMIHLHDLMRAGVI